MSRGPASDIGRDGQDDRLLSLLQWLLGIYLGLIPAGVLLIRFMALDTGIAMNWDRAVFWTLNALTCTGFDLATDSMASFTPAGAALVYMLMLYGAFFSLSAGGIVVCRLAGLAHSQMKIVLGAVLFLLIAILAGTGFLMTPERPLFGTIFESTSTVANAGMMAGEARGLFDVRLHAVVLPLAAIATLGMPVLIEVLEWLVRSRPLSVYSQRVLRLTTGMWLVGFVLLLAANWSLPWRQNVAASWLLAINTRSLAADVSLPGLPAVTWWILPVLMLIGANPGSTAPGGFQLPTLACIWSGSRRLRQGERGGRGLGGAMLYFAAVLMAFVGVLLVLVAMLPQVAGDRLVLLAAGSLTNTGISRDPLSTAGNPLYVLALAMLFGQVFPVAFGWWMTERDRNGELGIEGSLPEARLG